MSADKEVSFILRIKDQASAALKQVENASDRTVEKLFSLKDVLKGLVGAVEVFSVVELTKSLIELGVAGDKTFRQIAANLPTATEGIARLKEEIADLAVSSGRSLEAMQQGALQISKLGVGSAEDLKQQLEAATLVADATGAALPASIDLLQQLRREFHLTGDEALKTAANLVAAAKGKVGVEELFTAFQRATPVFQKFSIDAETGTRAIVALVAQGEPVRKIGTILDGLDSQALHDLAKTVTQSADAVKALREQADLTRGAAENSAQAVKTKFSAALEELGTKVLPPLIKLLSIAAGFIDFITAGQDKIAAKKAIVTLQTVNPTIYAPAEAQDASQELLKQFEHGHVDLGAESVDGLKKLAAELTKLLQDATQKEVNNFTKLRQEIDATIAKKAELDKRVATGTTNTSGKTVDQILAESAARKAAPEIEAILNRGQKAIADFALSTQKALVAGTSSATAAALVDLEAFSNKFTTIKKEIDQQIAAVNKLPPSTQAGVRKQLEDQLSALGGEYASGLAARLGAIDRIGADEAEKLRASVTEALNLLSGDLSKTASAAMAEHAKDIEKQILLNDDLTIAEKNQGVATEEALRRQVNAWIALKPVINEVERAIKAATQAIENADAVGPGLASTNRLNDALFRPGVRDAQGQLAGEGLVAAQQELIVQGELKGLTEAQVKDSQEYRDIQAKVLEIRKEIAKLLGQEVTADKQTVDTARAQTEAIIERARAIEIAVNGVIRLAGAFKDADQNLLHMLGSIGGLAAELPVLADKVNNLGKVDERGRPLATDSSVLGAAAPVGEAAFQLADSLNNLIGATVPTIDGFVKWAKAFIALNQEVAAFTDEVNGTISPLTSAINAVHQHAQALRDETEAALAGKKNADARNKLLATIAADEAKGIAQAGADYLQKQQDATQDYAVRTLRAQGLNAEADALAFVQQQQREYDAAVKEFGEGAVTAALKVTQATELVKHDAEVMEAAVQLQASLNIREAYAKGLTDEGDALTRRAQEEKELFDAQQAGYSDAQIKQLLYIQALEDTAAAVAKFTAAMKALADATTVAMQASAAGPQGTAADANAAALQPLFDKQAADATAYAAALEKYNADLADGGDKANLATDYLAALTAGIVLGGDAAQIAATQWQQAVAKINQATSDIQADVAIGLITSAQGLDEERQNFGFAGLSNDEIKALYTTYDPNKPLTNEQRETNKNVSQFLRDSQSANGAAGGGSGATGFAGSDTYNKSVTGTVAGISDSQAGGILGRLDVISLNTSFIPKIADLIPNLSKTYSTQSLAGLAPSSWNIGNLSMMNHFDIYIDNEHAGSFLDSLNNPAVMAVLDKALARSFARARAAAGAPRP